ncbi:MAG TPA: hypothetical protein PK867_16695 [Pirellulales bacterium]|nr:hypothetical protein [Pirellulales bacterium]
MDRCSSGYPPDVTTMNRLYALVVAHLAAGALLGWAASVYQTKLIGASFAALLFGQCALLAVWGGFSIEQHVLRYTGVCAGSAYLWFILCVATSAWQDGRMDEMIIFALVIVACVFPAIGVFRALRRWGPKLLVCKATDVTAAHQPFQFSTRHLLVLAFGVAVALAIGRAARAFGQSQSPGNWLYDGLICATLGACTLHLVLAAVWASLAAEKVFVRRVLAFAAAPLVGLVLPFYANEPTLWGYAICAAAAGGAQEVVMLSLEVVRSAGYRVVRTSAATTQTPQSKVVVAHPLD